MANSHYSLKHVSDSRIPSTWCKVWDFALDHGVYSMQALFILMCRLIFGDHTCPGCHGKIDPLLSFLEPACSFHVTKYFPDSIVKLIEDCHRCILEIGKHMSHYILESSFCLFIVFYVHAHFYFLSILPWL